MNARSLLFAFGFLVAAAVGAYLYVTGSRYVSTDNAYLKFDKVTLNGEVAGSVTALHVKENQAVREGELLVTLDEASYRAAEAKARAQLNKAESAIKSLKASYRTKEAELALAKDNLEFAQKEYQRQVNLSEKNLTSESLIDERRHALDIARKNTVIIGQELAQLRANLNDNVDAPVDSYAEVMAAQADFELAQINLAHTRITAPFDGFVSHLPKLGQRIEVGSPVLSLVSGTNAWIEANFKETEVGALYVGQLAEITIDAYPGLSWEGHVESLSPASGAEYSVLPPQNATGNWIKVVQRIPVRIRLHPHEAGPVLRAGMSAVVKIDTHQSAG